MKRLLKDIQLDCIKSAEAITKVAKSYAVKEGLKEKEAKDLEFTLSIGLQLYQINLEINAYKSGMNDSTNNLFKKVKTDLELTSSINLN